MPLVDFTVPGGLDSDAGTLSVDETNNRVGINDTTPDYALDVTGVVRGTGGVIGLTSAGAPATSIADGAFAVDTTNNAFYFRSGGVWRQVTGTSSTITVQDTPPTYAAGALWYESDTGKLFVGYDSYWVEVAGPAGPTGATGATGTIDPLDANAIIGFRVFAS